MIKHQDVVLIPETTSERLRWFVQRRERRDDEDGEAGARSEDLMVDGGGGHAAVATSKGSGCFSS